MTYFRKSCSKTQAQNGAAGRKHHHLNEIVRAFLIEANIPANFWVNAIQTAVFIVNRLPTHNLQGQSPFGKLFQCLPDYYFLKTFGCTCYPNFSASFSNKLAPRSARCIFLRYAPHYKGYKCFDPLTGRIYISWHVVFHEHEFPCLEFFHNLHSILFRTSNPSPECLFELSRPAPTLLLISPCLLLSLLLHPSA